MRRVENLLIDLAPGDRPSASFSWQGFQIFRVLSSAASKGILSDAPEGISCKDPWFDRAFAKLWEEFGNKGEMEQKDVILRRLQWDPSQIQSGFSPSFSLGYELIVVLKGDELAAIRDHSVIIRAGSTPEAIVHMSHSWIDPKYRGSGMVGWLRAWPVRAAHTCLTQAGFSGNCPKTLVAEMEPLGSDPSTPTSPDTQASQIRRLKSYQRAGFKMVDPHQVQYLQPDFRSPEEIDQGGGPRPLSLHLVIRRVDRETENEISGQELKRIILSLYQMYGTCFRPQDMAVVWNQFKTSSLEDDARIRLILPLGNEAP